MNTHGHHGVAEVAGELAIKEALGKMGKHPRMTAFYFGNWLTDLSQVYDPVAFAALAEKITDLHSWIDEKVDWALDNLLPGTVVCDTLGVKKLLDMCSDQESGLFGIDASIRQTAQEIKGLMHVVTSKLLVDPKGKKLYRDSFMSAVRFVAYFKFAHPAVKVDKKTGKSAPHPDSPFDFDSFLEIFESQFTQYFPHEHLDRWPDEPQAWKVSGELKASYDPKGSSVSPDMYQFLRDDIHIVAGQLARLDLEWASLYFREAAGKPIDDTSLEDWNEPLAKLGHALHAVEDFFAHSTFVEHAVAAMGDKRFLPKTRITKTILKWTANPLNWWSNLAYYKLMEVSNDETTLKRRLVKLHEKDPADPERDRAEYSEEKEDGEEHIVTGTFDTQDMIVSLAHLLEEVLDIEHEGLDRKVHEVHQHATTLPGKVRFAKEILTQTLEFAHDPKGVAKQPDVYSDDGDHIDHTNFIGKYASDLFKREKEQYHKTFDPLLGEHVPSSIIDKIIVSDWFWDEVLVVAHKLLVDVPKEFADGAKAALESGEYDAIIPKQIRQSLEDALRSFTSAILTKEELAEIVAKGETNTEIGVMRAAELIRMVLGFHGYYKRGLTLYEGIRFVVDIVLGPPGWIKRMILDKLPDWMLGQVKDIVVHAAEAYLLDMAGASRIGCHSLIAKDHGTEWLYRYQNACAKSVHWYVLHQILRWSRPDESRVCKSDSEASGTDHLNVIQETEYIDWMELLEFFLRHPRSSGVNEVGSVDLPETRVHVAVVGDSLSTLAEQYRPTAVDSTLTWMHIAEATFGPTVVESRDELCAPSEIDEDMLRALMEASGAGASMSCGLFGLRPGTRVLIPNQAWSLPLYEPVELEHSWFRFVLDREYEGLEGSSPGFTDFHDRHVKEKRSFHVPKAVSRDEVQALVSDAKEVEEAASERYNAAAVVTAPWEEFPVCEDEEAATLDQVHYDSLSPGEKYYWYRALIESRGAFDSSAGCVNICGIRGFVDGQRVTNKPNVYNDTIAVVWLEDGIEHCREYRASVDPGKYYTLHPLPDAAKAGGCAHLVDGQYDYRLGNHRGKPALRQAGSVRVWRDSDKDHVQDESESKVFEGEFYIHIHAGGVSDSVGASSAGCQVIAGGWGGTQWKQFYGIVSRHPNPSMRYTLVDSSDLAHVESPVGTKIRETFPGYEMTLKGLMDVQRALNHLGFADMDGEPLVEDGLNGPRTTHAVTSFQECHGLDPDSIAGPITKGRLQEELDREGIPGWA